MTNNYFQLSRDDRRLVLQQASAHYLLPPQAIEKDLWVTTMLQLVFTLPFSDCLIFKGGTSLSKVWHLVDRFSEDIDLSIDRTLSREQLSAWAALAAAHRKQAFIGDGAPLTGHNLFVCLNTNRSVLGVPVTKDAPADIHGSHYVAYDDIWITPDRLLISGLREPEHPDSRLVVRMAATDSPAVTKAWGRTVITGTFSTTDWGDIDLTEIYTEQFGIPGIAASELEIKVHDLSLPRSTDAGVFAVYRDDRGVS